MPGYIPEETIDQLRNRADIVEVIGDYLTLKRRGQDYWGLCPFHREKTPSFKVSAGHQTFHCFGCKKSGNVFTFVMERENVDFPGAIHLLGRRYGVRIEERRRSESSGSGASESDDSRGSGRARIYALLEEASEWYRNNLNDPRAGAAREYLQGRGLDQAAIAGFKLGYSPDSWDATLGWGSRHGYGRELMIAAGLATTRDDGPQQRCYDRFRGRLMFPIWDEVGRVVGFSARTLQPDAKGAKYINTPETAVFFKSKLLYGLSLARQAFKDKGHALVCEGQLDVIACHRAGLTNAVAPQGTAFTEEQARVLKRFADRVVFCFDADAAGEKAAVRSIQTAFSVELLPRVVALSVGEDPDSVFSSRGASGLQEAMSAHQDALEFVFNLAEREHGRDTPEGQTAMVTEVMVSIASQPSGVSRASSCQWLSRQLGLPESVLFEQLNRTIRGQHRRATRGARAAQRQAAHDGTAAPAAAPTAAPTILSVSDRARLSLLDLSLHHGFIAHDLVHLLPHDELRHTPIARALNLVIALTEQGEWSLAGQELGRDQELSTNPHIARILVASEFAGIDPEHADEHERKQLEQKLLGAMNDCLAGIELEKIRLRLQAIPGELAAAADDDQADSLLREQAELKRREAALAQSGRDIAAILGTASG